MWVFLFYLFFLLLAAVWRATILLCLVRVRSNVYHIHYYYFLMVIAKLNSQELMER
jgi:hypothetical protein